MISSRVAVYVDWRTPTILRIKDIVVDDEKGGHCTVGIVNELQTIMPSIFFAAQVPSGWRLIKSRYRSVNNNLEYFDTLPELVDYINTMLIANDQSQLDKRVSYEN